jgi:Dephospho-CoA kinase
MIIGITGNIGAGKDTFAQHLVVKGFIHISLSEFIREEVVKRGLEMSRENLHNISNEMRKNFGADILARMAIKK